MGRCAQVTAARASWGHWNQASLKRHSCRVDEVVSAGSCLFLASAVARSEAVGGSALGGLCQSFCIERHLFFQAASLPQPGAHWCLQLQGLCTAGPSICSPLCWCQISSQTTSFRKPSLISPGKSF